MQHNTPEFSVVIPIYNEEENIPELYRRLTYAMEGFGTYIKKMLRYKLEVRY